MASAQACPRTRDNGNLAVQYTHFIPPYLNSSPLPILPEQPVRALLKEFKGF
jgi:hypothetical protein